MQTWSNEAGRRLALLAAALLALPIALRAWAGAAGALPGERLVVRRLFNEGHTHGDTLRETANFFVGLGAVPVVVLTVAIAALVVHREWGRTWAVLVPAAAGAAVGAALLELLLGRTPLYEELLGPVATGSIPSGHTAYVAALFSLLAFLGLTRGRREPAVVAAIVVPGMATSLVLLGMHVPSDVIAGAAFGLGWALALVLLAVRAGAPRRV